MDQSADALCLSCVPFMFRRERSAPGTRTTGQPAQGRRTARAPLRRAERATQARTLPGKPVRQGSAPTGAPARHSEARALPCKARAARHVRPAYPPARWHPARSSARGTAQRSGGTAMPGRSGAARHRHRIKAKSGRWCLRISSGRSSASRGRSTAVALRLHCRRAINLANRSSQINTSDLNTAALVSTPGRRWAAQGRQDRAAARAWHGRCA